MPAIKWSVAQANWSTSLKLLAIASARTLSTALAYVLGRRSMSFRNEMARVWLGATFEQLPMLLYSEPAGHGIDKIKGEQFNAFLVPSEPSASLRDADSVVIFYHGGGMILGHPLQYLVDYERWTAAAAKLGQRMVIVGVQYPLSTSAKWPAQRDSALAAYRWVLSQGVKPSVIVLAGDSAGGNLVALSLLHIRDAPSGLPQPACAILISPWLDMSGAQTTGSPYYKSDFMLHYDEGVPIMNSALRPEGTDMSTPEISALLWQDVGSLPPQLVMYSSTEVLSSDSERWLRRSLKAGVAVTEFVRKGEMHTFAMGWPVCGQAVQKQSDEAFCRYVMMHTHIT